MAGLKSLASKIATKGRRGDSMLMHIQPGELAKLESMLGETTINPETGLPEAFSWKKLLASIGMVGASLAFPAISPFLIPAAIGTGISSVIPTKKKEEKLSEAGEYIKKRDAAEAAKNPGVPIISANINPYIYRPGGREQQQVSYGAPKPMSQGIQSLMGMLDENTPKTGMADPLTPKYAEGGMMEPEEAQARQVLQNAMAAMQGNSQDPHADLSKFIETYGEEAFQNLAGGGMVKGPGAGLDDMVSAQLGNQKVLLSNDEFVVPADVVSGLGDGSSESGARKLHAMMRRVRQERTGSATQPGKISDTVMPR